MEDLLKILAGRSTRETIAWLREVGEINQGLSRRKWRWRIRPLIMGRRKSAKPTWYWRTGSTHYTWNIDLPTVRMLRDNVFVERLWKSIQYDEVSLRAYETVNAA